MSESQGIALVRTGPDLLTPAITHEEKKYRAEKNYDKKLFKQVLQCTACEENIRDVIHSGSVYTHPFLKVLFCKYCHEFYGNGEFSIDEDGSDKYCRWCGQGGNLYCCSYCSVAVCLKCVQRNFGKSYRKKIEADDWKCFFCDTEPIWKHRALCAAAENYVEQRSAVKSKRLRMEVKELSSENESDESVFMEKDTLKRKYTSSDESQRQSKKSTPRKRHDNSVESENSQSNNQRKLIVHVIKETLNDYGKLMKVMEKSSNLYSEKYLKNKKFLKSAQSNEILKDQFIYLLKLSKQGIERLERNVLDRLTNLEYCSDGSKTEDDKTEDEQKSERKSDNMEVDSSVLEASQFTAKTTDAEAASTTANAVTVDTTDIETPSATTDPVSMEQAAIAIASVVTDTTDGKNVTEVKSSGKEVNLIATVSRDEESSCENEQSPSDRENNETNLEEASLIVHLDESETRSMQNGEKKTDEIEKSVHSNETSEVQNSSTSKDQEDVLNLSSLINEKEDAEKKWNLSKNEKDGETSSLPSDDNSLLLGSDSRKDSIAASSVKQKKINESVTESASKMREKVAKNALLISSDGMSSGSDSNTKSEEFGMSDVGSLKSDPNAEQHRKRKNKEKPSKEKLTKRKLMADTDDSEDDKEMNRLVNLKNLERRTHRCDTSADSAVDSADEKADSADEKITETEDNDKKPSLKKEEMSTSLMDYINNDSGGDSADHENIGGYFSEFNSFIENMPSRNGLNKEEIAKNLLLNSFSSDGADSEDNGVALLESTRNNWKDQLKSESDHETEKKDLSDKKKNAKWKRDKLLRAKLANSDTSDDESVFIKNGEKGAKSAKVERTSSKEDSVGDTSGSEDLFRTKKLPPALKRRKFQFSSSESNKGKSDSDSDSVTIISDVDASSNKKKFRKRKRIKEWSDSEESDSKNKSQSGSAAAKGRKNIRKLLDDDDLEETTRKTAQEEEERKKRIAQRQSLFNESFKIVGSDETTPESLVLDFDPQTKDAVITVHPRLVKKLKPHQAKGVKFMWDSCFESVKQIEKSKGGGCILAHCMGLGKTLQVIALVHTVLRYEETQVKKVLVICPLSTVQNWVNEFDMWLRNVPEYDFNVESLLKHKNNNRRADYLRRWHREGGVMVIGYEMFRTLVNASKLMKGVRQKIDESLLDPGPDLVVCDEGHMLKNETTALSQATMKIRTLRRIVLTGTPLQNNLKEYHCMVQFVKPNLLGTKKEFLNRFANPITNGQYNDSTVRDVRLMKRRSHVLHKLLDGIVQRFDYNVLTPFLPPKYEYVISVAVSDLQALLYEHYIKTFSLIASREKSSLFKDYQVMRLIWTHPFAMKRSLERSAKRKAAADSDNDSMRDFVVSGSDDDESSNDSEASVLSISSAASTKEVKKRATRSTKPDLEEVKEENNEEDLIAVAWWRDFVSDEDFDNHKLGPKLVLLFAILKECEEIGDKVLVFSQSIPSLDMIEYFLQKTDELSQYRSLLESSPASYVGKWTKNSDYFRLDGQTPTELRTKYCNAFNKTDNFRSRLFLISTKAGGLGINLTAANRVIIFDASWNPSHDVQSIFRVYRFGQNKPCYIYRLLSQGTMEEKIYERQVTKLSISCRVVDEQQIDRHFSRSEIEELYTFNRKTPLEDETPILPKDRLMAELVKEYKHIILSYHEHDSLLENIVDEELTEEERKMAWEEYENDKKPKIIAYRADPKMIPDDAILAALRREHPTASEPQLKDMFTQVRLKLLRHFGMDQSRVLPNAQLQMNSQNQVNNVVNQRDEEMREAAYVHHEHMMMNRLFNQGANLGTSNALQQSLKDGKYVYALPPSPNRKAEDF